VTRGYVYAVQRPDGLVKIGWTTDPDTRLEALGFTHRWLYEVAVFPGTRADEAELHRRWADQREEGEWFRPSDGMLQELAASERAGTTA
jgi:hypothetical protein